MNLPIIIPADLPEIDVRMSFREDGSPALHIGRKGSFGTAAIEGKWSKLEANGKVPAGWLVSFSIPVIDDQPN